MQQAASTVATAISRANEPAEQDSGCQDRRDKRTSDLCAQWKAADAARDAADYAFWTLLISTFGSGLLIWTLWETRSTSRRELRAYVSVVPMTLTTITAPERKGEIEVKYDIKNEGPTPAYDMCNGALIALLAPEDVKDFAAKLDPMQRSGEVSRFTLHSGQMTHGLATGKLPVNQDGSFNFPPGHSVYVFGFVEYRDTFGYQRKTLFGNFIRGQEFLENVIRNRKTGRLVEVKWRMATAHNLAT